MGQSRKRSGQRRRSLLLLGLSLIAGISDAQVDFYDLRPTLYSDTTPQDPVAKLWARKGVPEAFGKLKNGKEALRFILRELEVPEESQVLVFSKTSLQAKLINPRTPRALYFSEDVYVGWVPGGMIELIAFDPQLGPVFYAARVPGSGGTVGIERALSCLQCHATSRTEGVPGMLVRSVVPDRDGFPILSAGTFLTTHASPLSERWGGWYVTGESDDPHLGNRTTTEEELEAADFAQEHVTAMTDLAKRADMSRYLQPTSDVVALMILEHQCRMHNLMTKAALSYRRGWYLQQAMNAEADPADEDGVAWRIARSGAEDILEELLFCGEAVLGGDGVQGSEAFQEVFEAGAPMSSEGRSLREFRLYKRLFRYRCSYVIYSSVFQDLPPQVRDRVLERLREVLTSEEREEKFAHLKSSECQRILAILRETLPNLPKGW